MKIGIVSQCTRRLNFEPRAIWPAVLPAVAWNEILLTGFDRVESFDADASACLFISPDEYGFEETLSSLYPKLSFLEFSRLFARVEDLATFKVDWPDLCTRLGMRWSDDWPLLFALVNSAPAELRNWCETREISPRDLAPLKALPVDARALWFELAKKAVSFAPSKSDGVQVLEWLVDILLMADVGAGINAAKTFGEFREYVRRLRFPQTSQSERSREKFLSQFSWPPKTKPTWVRHGDRDGVAIQLFSHSAEDLKNQIASLQTVVQQWRASDIARADGASEGN